MHKAMKSHHKTLGITLWLAVAAQAFPQNQKTLATTCHISRYRQQCGERKENNMPGSHTKESSILDKELSSDEKLLTKTMAVTCVLDTSNPFYL